jgi:hypothetical protein
MVSTYGTLGLGLPDNAEDDWGDDMNNNWDLIDTQLKTNENEANNNKKSLDTLIQSSAGGVNQLTNGNFEIWQRGESILVSKSSPDPTKFEDGDWICDMWRAHRGGANRAFWARRGSEEGHLSFVNGEGVESSEGYFLQLLERYHPHRGGQITLSIDVRAIKSESQADPVVTLVLDDGKTTVSKAVFLNADSSWVRVTIAKVIAVDAGKVSIRVHFTGLRSGVDLRFRRAMLVAGNRTNAIYVFSDADTELRRCKRYYETWVRNVDATESGIGLGFINNKKALAGDVFIDTLVMSPKYIADSTSFPRTNTLTISTVSDNTQGSTSSFAASDPGNLQSVNAPTNGLKLTITVRTGGIMTFRIKSITVSGDLW